MKIVTKRSCEGGTLLVTLVVCGVVGLMLIAYLSMVSSQHTFTQRSQVWNNCIPMCEAGVEDALAHLNHSETKSNFAINGWVKYGAFYRKDPVNLNGGSYYVAIDTNYPPSIVSTGRLDFPLTSTPIIRAVRVQTKINQRFPDANLAKGRISLGGGGRVDSFNSTNALESTGGKYDPALATDRATVVTTSRTPGDLVIGNVSIYGSVGTGPGGTYTMGPQGNVGSAAFNDDPGNNGQIEDQHYTDDVNIYIPDATFPSPYGPVQSVNLGIYLINGTNYNYHLQGGDYRINTIYMAAEKMYVSGKVRIHVFGMTTLTSLAFIQLGPNASVEWYAGGNVSLSGKGVINGGGFAKNFSVIGLNGCTSVYYSGTSQFIGTIYAPHAAVTITGTADAFGAIVGKTITLSGNMNFHYDEALKGDPKEGKFLAASWREL